MSGLTVAEVLDRAADKLDMPGAWTQGEFAKNAVGQNTGLSEFRGPAVCWCAYGAIDAVSDDEPVVVRAELFLKGTLGNVDIATWNDAPERTQAEVVAKLREAAALARQPTPSPIMAGFAEPGEGA